MSKVKYILREIMRKLSLFVLLFGVGITGANGQSLKEKMASKLEATKKGMEDKNNADSEAMTSSFQSLSDVAKNWSDGSYSGRRVNGGMLEPMGKKEIKFTKGTNDEITNINIDGTDYPQNKFTGTNYVMTYGKNQMNLLYLTPSTIVKYRMSNGKSIIIERVYGQKIGLGKAKKEIAAYREHAEGNIDADQEATAKAEAEARAKAEAERKAKFGLEGKSVKKIEIVNLNVPEKFGHYGSFSFDMKATLSDGSVISTVKSEEGYMSDYEISYGDSKFNGYTLDPVFDKDDKIVVTVSLKSNPSIKTSEEFAIPYGDNISWKYSGTGWTISPGESAMSYRMELKQVKHAVTGAKLLKVRVTNVSTGELVNEVKIDQDKMMFFYCAGGNGGVEDGRGNSGGNGGNLTVVKDPNVEYYNLEFKNHGGRGGYPGGRDGRDGVFKEETRAVNL